MISILDYGAGNALSVIRMIERAGGKAEKISLPEEVERSEKLIIPGVGAFDHGMRQLCERGLVASLNRVVLEKKIPVMGICLGMQLMCRRSDEGSLQGLGWIDAEVVRFSEADMPGIRVPHMGWNQIRVVRENSILDEKDLQDRFYFVHSFYVSCSDDRDPVAYTRYGNEFVSVFQKENIIGVQFHPEKSHRFGLELMRRFVGNNHA